MIFTFSTKHKSDEEFIKQLKADNQKIGRHFSHVVVEALRAYYYKDVKIDAKTK